MRRILFIFFTLSLSGGTLKSYAQNISASEKSTGTRHDTAIFISLMERGTSFQNTNADSAVLYHLLAKKCALKTNDGFRIIPALNELIWDYFILSDFDKALSAYNEATGLTKKMLLKTKVESEIKSIKASQAACMVNMGSIYNSTGDFKRALDYYQMALRVYQDVNDEENAIFCLGNIGSVYSTLGDHKLALDYFFKGLRLNEKIGNRNGQAGLLGNIGLIYTAQKDYVKAFECHSKSLKINQETGNKLAQSDNYSNLGFLKDLSGDHDAGLEYLMKSLAIGQELGNKDGISQCFGNIGLAYYSKGKVLAKKNDAAGAMNNYEKALEYFEKAIKLDEEISNKQDLALNLGRMSATYITLKKYAVAEMHLKKAFALSTELGLLEETKTIHREFSRLYEKTNRPALSLHHFKLFIQYGDSINNEENIKATIQQEMKFSYDKKATADSIFVAEEKKISQAKLTASEASLKQEKTQRLALYGGLALLVIFAAVMVNRFRVVNRQKKLIEMQKKIVDEQKLLVEEKQKEVLDSIYYAKRIQTALLPNEKYIYRVLNKLHK